MNPVSVFSLSYTDAQDIISRKILVNKMAEENLKNQIQYSHSVAQLQLLSVKLARMKLKYITELNTVMEQQLHEFTEERQNKCLELYAKINELDTPTEEWKRLLKDCERSQEQMLTLLPKIQHIESTIPEEMRVTNFKIRPKPPADKCSDAPPAPPV